jgi:hypothetical protein
MSLSVLLHTLLTTPVRCAVTQAMMQKLLLYDRCGQGYTSPVWVLQQTHKKHVVVMTHLYVCGAPMACVASLNTAFSNSPRGLGGPSSSSSSSSSS